MLVWSLLCQHGSAFSPRNAQIGLLEGHKVHAFYSCGCTDSGNMVIVYHIVTSSEVRPTPSGVQVLIGSCWYE